MLWHASPIVQTLVTNRFQNKEWQKYVYTYHGYKYPGSGSELRFFRAGMRNAVLRIYDHRHCIKPF